MFLFPDLIDVVKDQLYGADYVREEDPKVYHSEKSGRGPLSENWLDEYWSEVSSTMSTHAECSIYCLEYLHVQLFFCFHRRN